MASIQRLISPLTNEVSYRAQVRVKGRTSESATFPTRKEATTWAASIETAIREGRHFPHAAARRTRFDDLVKDYIKTVLVDADPKQIENCTRDLMWWSTKFEGLHLADITSDRISQARDDLQQVPYFRGKPHTDPKTGEVTPPKEHQRTGATINRSLAALSHLMSFAVKERRLLDRNPLSDIAKKREPRGRTRFLSDAERDALLAACAKSDWASLHTLVVLAISTGARRSELTNLKWRDIDLQAARALVSETKNDEPKVLPLVGKALKELRLLKLKHSATSEWVFPKPSGLPGPFKHFDAHWYKALEVAGLEDFKFHDLRHTCASYLASQGASLLEIADVLGHKTLQMVKRYSHLAQSHKSTVIQKMAKKRGL